MVLPTFSENPLRTREDAQQLLRDLVTPVLPHFSPGRARVTLGENRALYGDPAGLLEGFARPLWGLVPLAAGGGSFDHWPLWQEGIIHGTDPQQPEAWGFPGDWDQRSVEQAAFGFALLLAPHLTWDPLPAAARANFSTWLRRINHVKLVNSNWLFFRVLVNLALRRVGQPWSQEQLDVDLDAIDRFYLGDGWYSDGPDGPPHRDGRRGDYYVPMALHFYALVYARVASADDPVRAARYIERARAFARDFAHYFAADGAALPFGRSLAYRFAQGAFWGGLAFADVEALPWGVVKGLFLRHLRWWMRQPIFSETGLLTIGYTYPNLLMAESYNSPGSPYWALKAFLPLAVPAEHPFWRAEEEPLPRRPAVVTVPGAGLILVTDPRSRDVTAINPGQPVLDWPRNAPHKYSKIAYATRFGFAVPASVSTPSEGGLDTGVAISDDGRFFRTREHCLDAAVADGVAFSRWQPWPDVELRTWTLALPTAHVRVHHLRCTRKLWLLDAGFAVGYTQHATLRAQAGAAIGPLARSPGGSSLLHPLTQGRRATCEFLGANSPLYQSLAAMPALHSAHEPGEHWLACIASGSADPADEFAALMDFSFELTPAGCRLLRGGHPWWTHDGRTPCGASSEARLRTLAQPA